MLTTQEKINVIYERIANKEMSFWCRFKVENFEICYEFWHDVFDTEWELLCTYIDESGYWVIEFKVLDAIPYDKELWDLNIDHKAIENEYAFDESWEQIKIIWHPVMIGDALDYLYEEFALEDLEFFKYKSAQAIELWENLKLPIEEQSDKCVDFIYSMVC